MVQLDRGEKQRLGEDSQSTPDKKKNSFSCFSFTTSWVVSSLSRKTKRKNRGTINPTAAQINNSKPMCLYLRMRDKTWHRLSATVAEESSSPAYNFKICIEREEGGKNDEVPTPQCFSPVLQRYQHVLRGIQSIRIKRFRSERGSLTIVNDPSSSIQDIIRVMKAHPQSSTIQNQGCTVLTSLAKEANHRAEISSDGGISVVLDAMKGHPNHPDVQGHGCSALGNLAAFDHVNKETIASGGGIHLILDAMNQHVDESVLQEKACGAIFNLAFHGGNRTAITSSGGIKAIVRAMEAHKDEASVQNNACSALWNLSGDLTNAVVFTSSKEVDTVVRCMKAHRCHPGVQHSGCGVLRSLSIGGRGKDLIAGSGGVAALLGAMEMHPESSIVQREACGALRNLSRDPLALHKIKDHPLLSYRVLENAADTFPLECEDNAESVLEKIIR